MTGSQKISINDRQLATVLAALRYWQQNLSRYGSDNMLSHHFEEHTPLTIDEIDELCEQLNCSSKQETT